VLGQEEEEGVGTATWRSGKLDDFPNLFLQCNFIFSQLELKQNFYEKLL
jgi:hypothetical protein